MVKNGAKDKDGDSAEMDLVSVGQALVLVQIVGIDCLYQHLCVIWLPHVSELHAVFSIIPLSEGLSPLGKLHRSVYQEVTGLRSMV